MKLLAINPSAKEAQICLINEDNRIIKEMHESKSHSEFLLKEIDNLLIANEVDISEIDCLSVNIGPGSFTGIRIGISFVKAFMCALDQKTVVVNNFEIINANIEKKEKEYFIILPSNNDEIYYAKVESNVLKYGYISIERLNEISNSCELNVYCDEKDFVSFSSVENLISVKVDRCSFLNISIEKVKNQDFSQINEISPLYIKKSQAENELLKQIEQTLIIDNVAKLEDISNLENKCFSSPYSDNLIMKDIEDKNRTLLFAHFKGEVIGYICYEKILDEMELLRVCVLEEFRQYKIATKLMEKMIEEFNSGNFKKIFLEVDEENLNAVKLYEKFGFKKIGERKNYYQNGHNAFVYALEK